MIGAETIALAGVLASREALKKTVNELYDAVSAKTAKLIRNWKNDQAIARLYTQVAKVKKVKTLGQLDKAVDLLSFYCDSHVYIGKHRRKITNYADFNISDNVLIEGIAGQGKSIFLRYLSYVELTRGEYIPIFIELRFLETGQTLMDHILRAFKALHVNIDAAAFADLANSGRVILLLDAFDEVPEALRSALVAEINALTAENEKLKIIVTSRPESGVSSCPTFHKVTLSDLEGTEFQTVINRITDDPDMAKQLIKQVLQHKGGIRELLLTPLLVTLLVIRYKSYQELPEQMADFYDSPFQLLLQRHDGTKPSYRRPRQCDINDYQYRHVFEAFCFFAKRAKYERLSSKNIYPFVEAALKDRRIAADPEKYLSDIVKITCLLVKDGEEFRFIHKSVQEYYCAAYIRSKPAVVLEKFYPRIFSGSESWNFIQELAFLSEVDKYHYFKFGLLPFLSGLFKCEPLHFYDNPTKTDFNTIELELMGIRLAFLPERKGIASFMVPAWGPLMSNVTVYPQLFNLISELDAEELLLTKGINVREKKGRDGSLRVADLLPEPRLSAHLAKSAQSIATVFFKEGRKAHKFVSLEEEENAVLEFPELGP